MKTYLGTLLFCLISAAALAQAFPVVRHLRGAAVPAAQLTGQLARLVDSAQVAGLSVLVLDDNRVSYEQYFGTKDRRSGQAPDHETVSYAASLTKPLVAYLFLRLVDQGVFALDTPVYRYLRQPIAAFEKWQDLAQDQRFTALTARMLLCHSSGLPILRGFYGQRLATIATPGSRFFYSNEGYNLLGLVMEQRTGLDLQALAQREVFGPLGMARTSLVWQPQFATNRAVGHDYTGQVLGAQQRSSPRAAGSMVTTPADYAAFLRQVLAGRGLSRKAYREYLKPQIAVGSQRGWGPRRDSLARQPHPQALAWALGWSVFKSGYGPAFWHGGHADGWQNLCISYPRKKLAVILLSNSDNFERVADQVLRLCLGDADVPLEWAGFHDPRPR